MKKILIVTGTALLALFFAAGCRHSHCGYGHGFHKNPKEISQKISSKLGLDEGQKIKMDNLVKKTFDQMPDMKKNREVLVSELIREFESEKYDKASLNRILTDMENDVKKMKELMLNSGEEFFNILTPDQRKKVVEKLKKHQERMESWKKHETDRM